MMKLRLLATMFFCLVIFIVSPKFSFAADPPTMDRLGTSGVRFGNFNSNLPFTQQATQTPSTAVDMNALANNPAYSGILSNPKKLVPCDGACTLEQLKTMGVKIYNYLVGFGAILAVGAIVWAGFSYITAAGDSGKMSAAKEKIYFAIIGIIVLAASALIVNTVMSWIGVTGNTKKVEDVKAQ